MKKLILKREVIETLIADDKRHVVGGADDINMEGPLIITTSGRPNTNVSCGSCVTTCPLTYTVSKTLETQTCMSQCGTSSCC